MAENASPGPGASARGAAHALHFDGFVILPGERSVLVQGEPAKLGARAFDVLMALVAARDRVVSKAELMESVWPDLVVEENNLSVHVSQLRKVCGPRAIATVPGRGYQFIAASLPGGPAEPRAGVDAGDEALGFPMPTGGNLPLARSQLIGRDAECRELLAMVQTHRWVTLTGPGGIGKTRLAEAVGQSVDTATEAWLVELASVSDPAAVANEVAQALGVALVDTARPLQALVAALHGRRVLLILDNCEHLGAAVSALCIALLRDLPQLHVLVTSQELLRDPEEVVYKLGPLALPDPHTGSAAAQVGSLQLLEARVRAVWRHFEITDDNIDDAIVVCRQLDGLPLAIELAAARVPVLGLSGVRERLGELFRLLTGDARVRLRRHQTLRAALDWSYHLLLPTERALLRRLGVFAGTFSIEGVRALAGDLGADEWDVLDTLASLVEKSLVQVKGLDTPRYLLLETMRAYALEQLAVAEETHDALARHAHATNHVCVVASRRRDTAAIWDETANIRAAFRWAMRNDHAELAVALVNHSSVVLALGGLVGEVVQRLVEVEPCVTDALPRPLVAQYWQWLGRFGSDGRLPASRCLAALQTAEQIFRELANERHVHACLRMRAEALVELGDIDGAAQAIDAARRIETARSPLADRMRRVRIEGKVLEGRGDFTGAVERFELALDISRMADIHRYVATLTMDIGQTLLHGGDAAGAEARFRAVLDDQRPDLSVALAIAYAHIGLATSLLMQGRLSDARAVAVDAVPRLRSCGILLAHSEVFAWLLAELGQASLVGVLLVTSDSFRSHAQRARGPTQTLAYDAAQRRVAERGTVTDGLHEPIASDAELAQVLSVALAALA